MAADLIDVKIVSDSLPLALIPNFTSVVTEFGTEPRELAVTCRTP